MSALGGRRIHPAALALTLAASVEAAVLLPFSPWVSARFGGPAAVVGGVIAALAAVAFVAAWFTQAHRLLVAALDASAVLWCWVALVAFTSASPVSGVLALAWVTLAAGSAWLERGDDDG